MHHSTDLPPSLVVDVTSVFERKMALIQCFASQLHDPASKEPGTRISSADFLPAWEARHRWFGERIGVRFGEPWYLEGPVPVLDPVALLRKD
jgi:LmbE family N-acetylglucosaminyl deacetylase